MARSPEQAKRGGGDVWRSGEIVSPELGTRPTKDLPLSTHQRYWWAVRLRDAEGRWSPWSPSSAFTTGIIAPDDWQARWIAGESDRHLPPHVAGQAKPDMVPAKPLPLLRREIAIRDGLARATISVAGLGQYALAINGQRVGEAVLAPGWTNYRKSVLYDSYDVTDALKSGSNALALMLGNGMYNVEHKNGRYTKFLDSFGQPKAILRLTLDYVDGHHEVIASDADWRVTPGPIRFSSIYGGEDIDGRLYPTGWDRPGFDASGWKPVRLVDGPGGNLVSSGIPAVAVTQKIDPVSVSQVGEGVLLVDLGKNFAGRPVLELNAARGTEVTVTPGEELDDSGRVTQRSFNAAPGRAVQFRYIAEGSGLERFRPEFTYHGFRYIEIVGLSREQLKSVWGEFLRCSVERSGKFHSGVPLFNAIHGLIEEALLSNTQSVLTDCPQREKLGWLEQTYLNAPTVLYNLDAITLYEKMARDIEEAQQTDGMVPGIAPEYVAFIDAEGRDQIWRNSPEWGIAAVLSPWAAYRFTGDLEILYRSYRSACQYLDYLDGRLEGGLLDFGMGDWYDIGPRDPGPAQLTSRKLTGTAVYIEGLMAIGDMARLLGRTREVSGFERRARTAAEALNASFLDRASGKYEHGSQTAQAMPLALGIVPSGIRAKTQEQLVRAVRASGNAVTAGDIGFRYVLDALSQSKRDDVVRDMLSVTDRPSYGYQLHHGATALTEAWDANPANSQNHFMLGHAENWFYRRLAGLDIDHARNGAARLTFAPRLVPGIPSASASYILSEGLISSSWRVIDNLVTLDIEVPPGRDAKVVLEGIVPVSLRLNGVPALHARGNGEPEGGTMLTVGSGHYRLRATLAPNFR
ncbi:MAG: family 78 glycoside hydrolase catalytic domain [Sphingomonadaceae bacterium]